MLKTKNKPYHVILVTDPNSDPDDLISYLILKQLAVQSDITMDAVVVTLGVKSLRQRRAKFASAVWQQLKIDVPVIYGADYPDMDNLNSDYCENEWVSEVEKSGIINHETAETVILRVLQQSADKSVVVLLNAQMNDIAAFLQTEAHQNLFEQKVLKVVLMGTYGQKENGVYLPSPKSFNNKVCMPGAERLFRYLQQKKIPLFLVPKETVYQVRVGKEFYEKLKIIDTLISKVLYCCSRQCMENLWNEVKSGRVGHFDLKRYIKVFIGSDYQIRSRTITKDSPFDEVWKNVKYFSLYDALAALAVSEHEFLQGGEFEKPAEGKEVYVAKINNPEMIRNKLYAMCEKSLTDMEEK